MLRLPVKSTRYIAASVIVLIPPAVSVVVAACIYRLNMGYFIALLSTSATGLYLVGGLFEGELNDNWGRHVRETNPVGFWVTFMIWLMAYILFVYWPVGYALQERSKEDKLTARARQQVYSVGIGRDGDTHLSHADSEWMSLGRSLRLATSTLLVPAGIVE